MAKPPFTPPRHDLPILNFIHTNNETPAPARARNNHLESQVSELIRTRHVTERRHKADIAGWQAKLSVLEGRIKDSEGEVKRLKDVERDLRRCKAEGEGMRDELNMWSELAQRKAVLVLAQEQMQSLELEHRLVQADTGRIMRDHKISLFQARELDLLADLAERDTRLAELEASLEQANTSMVHQRAAESKTSALELKQAHAEISTLESKVEVLEGKLKALKEREKEARAELDGWLRDEKGKEGSATKETNELKSALRTAKNDLQRKTEQLGDVQEELASLKETSKEREKALKIKLREATTERDKFIGIEEEVEGLRQSVTAAQSEAKKAKAALRAASGSAPPEELTKEIAKTIPPKVKKVAPIVEEIESDTEPAPKKRNKKPQPTSDSDGESSTSPKKPIKKTNKPVKPKVVKAPLAESTETANKPKTKRKSPEPDVQAEVVDMPVEGGGGGGVKKKRKLFGGNPTFQWDSLMNTGDGVIPGHLSPIRPPGKGTVGAIPRIGFPSMASSRNLAKF